MPHVLATLDGVLDGGQGVAGFFPEIPDDIVAALQAEPGAWERFQAFSPAYIRIRLGYVEGARARPEEYAKRLRYFVSMTAKGKQFGYGGIEKHY